MSRKHETRLPIGDDFYLTLSQYHGETKMHIRKFETRPSLYNDKQTFIVPTKLGITMTLTQMQTLKKVLPTIMPDVFANNAKTLSHQFAKDVSKISLGGYLYLTVCSLGDGDLKIHIRNFVPMSLLNKATDNPDKLQPTKNGVVLTTNQTIELFKHLETNDLFLMPPPKPLTLDLTGITNNIHIDNAIDQVIRQRRSTMIDKPVPKTDKELWTIPYSSEELRKAGFI